MEREHVGMHSGPKGGFPQIRLNDGVAPWSAVGIRLAAPFPLEGGTPKSGGSRTGRAYAQPIHEPMRNVPRSFSQSAAPFQPGPTPPFWGPTGYPIPTPRAIPDARSGYARRTIGRLPEYCWYWYRRAGSWAP